MTNEDWKKVEKELSIVGLGHVQLKIDDYKVDLFLTQISMFKNGIVFYVFLRETGLQMTVKKGGDFAVAKRKR